MESTNHSRVLKLIQEMAKTSEITGDEKDQLKEKLMNDDSVMAQILEICHKFTDNDIKIELKNLVKGDSNTLNFGMIGSGNAGGMAEDSSPLGAALMKRKRKGKKEEEPGAKKGFSLGGNDGK